jgi:uncharacterized protein YjbI with pentapeptide repeats
MSESQPQTKVAIIHRWTGVVLYECEDGSLKEAVEKADLSEADLSGADLSGANLIRANLIRANLIEADLSGANLSGANLSGADLSGANLIRANLIEANLSGADLIRANLSGANLIRANLIRANLSRADLSRADLSDIKADFCTILEKVPSEVPGLLAALRDGRIDGSSYEGDCACLVGTIANIRHCHFRSVPGLAPDSSRPAERFFLAIREDDTPADNPVAAIVEGWILEWLEAHPVEAAAV